MTFLITLLIVWVVCMPASYLLFRREQKRMFDAWTQADRLFALIMSLFGPIAVLINLLISALTKLERSQWSKQEAKW